MTDLATTQELEACEEVIERGLKTFVEVGNEFSKIKEEKLYRQGYSNFENYCRDRWGFTRDYAYKQIQAAKVVNDLVDDRIQDQLPSTETQARELAQVPREKRTNVWKRTLERTDGKPTAKAIRETYKALNDPPADDVKEGAVIPPVKGGDAESPNLEPEDTCPNPVGDFTRAMRIAKNILGNLCEPQFNHKITEDEYKKTKRLLEASLKQLERNYQK